MTTTFISDGFCTDLTLPIAKRDALFEGVTSGLWGFDLASPYSFPRQADPITSDSILDLDEWAGDGQVVIASGQSLGFSGRQLDFSALSIRDSYLEGPSGVLASIWGQGSGATATSALDGGGRPVPAITNGGAGYISGKARALFYKSEAGQTYPVSVVCTVVDGVITHIPTPTEVFTGAPEVTIVPSNQEFLFCMYVKLPTEADWYNEAGNSGRFPMFQTAAGAASTFFNAADLFSVNQQDTSKRLHLVRQTGLSSSTSRGLALVPAVEDYGAVCQIAYWRKNGVDACRLLRLDDAAIAISNALGTASAPNKEDFTAGKPKFGVAGGFATALGGGVFNAAQQNASKFRVGRGFIEALDLTGRDPVTVLSADWQRTLDRGVYS